MTLSCLAFFVCLRTDANFSGANMKILVFTLTIFLTGYSGKLKYSCNTFCPFPFFVDHRARQIVLLFCSPVKNNPCEGHICLFAFWSLRAYLYLCSVTVHLDWGSMLVKHRCKLKLIVQIDNQNASKFSAVAPVIWSSNDEIDHMYSRY